MMTRLQNKLPAHVELQAYGKDDLTENVLNQTDFFVSTLPLQLPGADVLRTSPLITGSEFQHILAKSMPIPISGKNLAWSRLRETPFYQPWTGRTF